MSVDGSIQQINCITQHEDFDAITNCTILLHVTPHLRSQDGGTYRCLFYIHICRYMSFLFFLLKLLIAILGVYFNF